MRAHLNQLEGKTKKMITAKIREELISSPWLITQEGFMTLQDMIASYQVAEDEDEDEQYMARDNVGGIAVIDVKGTMMRNVHPLVAKLFGLVDTARLRETINEVAESGKFEGILLDIDSPGGSASGIEEASEAVRMANEKMPVYSYVEGLMASAAYWVGSQARTIVASNSSKVGSIGVYLPVVDSSESYKSQGIKVELIKNKEATYKGAGFEGTSLSDDQKEYMQEMVQDIFEDFKGGVLSARPQIKTEAMRGQVYLGRRAKSVGLVDMNGSYEDALKLLSLEIER